MIISATDPIISTQEDEYDKAGHHYWAASHTLPRCGTDSFWLTDSAEPSLLGGKPHYYRVVVLTLLAD